MRAKSIVQAVATALKISRVSPLAPASAVQAPAGRSSVWTRGGELRDFELELVGDTWRGVELR